MTESPRAAASFDVIDLFDGFFALARRSPTLDGSTPIRAATACVPLLEGNAFGWQVTLARRLELGGASFGFRVVTLPGLDDLARAARALAPVLAARGLLSTRHEAEIVRASPVTCARLARRVSIFTGLLVRPRPGVALRLSSTANRRPAGLRVDDVRIEAPEREDGAYTPLVLDLELDGLARGESRVLTGELATLAALPARVEFEVASLASALDVGRAHLAFYDPAYFATKKSGEPARKYKKAFGGARARDEGPGSSRAPSALDEGGSQATLVVDAGPIGLALSRSRDDARARLVFRNPLEFTAHYDGASVALEYDQAALAELARATESVWETALGPELPAPGADGRVSPRGALLYLTKYFTQHPPGEPHFFVKPTAFVRTPPGWSTLVEGTQAADHDVLRGVVKTDVFHATPAVFQLVRRGHRVTIARGAELCELIPFERALEALPFERVELASVSGAGT